MDDITGGLGMALFLVLSTIGAVFIVEDFRNFDIITEQCKTQGYIQNKTTRIVCSIEEKQK